MPVYDRWHKTHPNLDDPDPAKRDRPCRCGRGRNRLYPTDIHGQGKRWQVRWDVIDEKGKRHQPRKNFAELRGDNPDLHAEAYDAQTKAELDTDTYIDREAGNTTLREFSRTWQDSQVGDLASLENYRRRLAHILGPDDDPTFISKTGMAKLAKKPSLIQQWVKRLETQGLSAGYIRDIADTLSSIFLAAIEDGVAPRNPVRARSVRLPFRDQPVIEPWTSQMAGKARAQLEKRRGCGAMVDLGAGAGLRQGEIFAVAEDDIVFLGKREDRKIKVRRQVKVLKNDAGKYVPVFAPPKRGKERDVPLSDALGRILSAHIKAHPPVQVTLPWKTPDGKPRSARLLFVRPDGSVWHRSNFGWYWKKARLAAGALEDHNGMHVLRHTYASVNLHRGVDVIKVAAWLGHRNAAFTLKVYGHFIPDLADLGREAVDEFLEPKQVPGESEAGEGRG